MPRNDVDEVFAQGDGDPATRRISQTVVQRTEKPSAAAMTQAVDTLRTFRQQHRDNPLLLTDAHRNAAIVALITLVRRIAADLDE